MGGPDPGWSEGIGGGALAFALDWERLGYFFWKRPPLPYAYSWLLGFAWGRAGEHLVKN